MRSQLDACEGFARAARLGRSSRWPSLELELEAEGDTGAACGRCEHQIAQRLNGRLSATVSCRRRRHTRLTTT